MLEPQTPISLTTGTDPATAPTPFIGPADGGGRMHVRSAPGTGCCLGFDLEQTVTEQATGPAGVAGTVCGDQQR